MCVIVQINNKKTQTRVAKMHNKVPWDDYLYFLKVARLGSLKAASKALRVNHSTVLRRINALEEKLEARLFDRFKTGYELTESGKQIFEQIDHIEEEFLAVERKILGRDIRYEGRIKISTTDTLAQFWLPPYVKEFKEIHPGILLDIEIKTGYTDLTKREADIVLSVVNHHPDFMIGKILTPIALKLYASHDYLKKHGRPNSPQDLASHKLIILNEDLNEIGFNEWVKKLVPKSAINLSVNMVTSMHSYAAHGLGIAPLPTYVGDSDSKLISVMDVPEQFHLNIWMLTHPDLKNTRRIKAFMQFMYEKTKQ